MAVAVAVAVGVGVAVERARFGLHHSGSTAHFRKDSILGNLGSRQTVCQVSSCRNILYIQACFLERSIL